MVRPIRRLHASPALLSPRIMSVDRVPGVKMANSGAPVREKLSTAAVAGVSRLEAAIAKQQAEKAAKAREAAQRMQDVKRAAAQGAVSTPRLRLAAVKRTLDASIDGQDLAKDVVARALRRRSLKLDDHERPLRLLFAGPSGVGKTAMATAVCEALLGSCEPDRNFKRCVQTLGPEALSDCCLADRSAVLLRVLTHVGSAAFYEQVQFIRVFASLKIQSPHRRGPQLRGLQRGW